MSSLSDNDFWLSSMPLIADFFRILPAFSGGLDNFKSLFIKPCYKEVEIVNRINNENKTQLLLAPPVLGNQLFCYTSCCRPDTQKGCCRTNRRANIRLLVFPGNSFNWCKFSQHTKEGLQDVHASLLCLL